MRTTAGFFMPAKRIYSKPPTNFDEQIQLLKSRGLIISDEQVAADFLKYVSYYRLSAYTYYFEKQCSDGTRSHTFHTGKTFEEVMNLYIFDSKLRRILLDAVERIEIAFRTSVTYHLSHKYGAHWFLQKKNFHSRYNHNDLIDTIKEESGFNDIPGSNKRKMGEVFIQHYYDSYHTPELPPSWMVSEILSLGKLSRLYSNLQFRDDQKLIANDYGLHYTVLESWIHSLSYVRNLCAHYCRIWNRTFTIKPLAAKRYETEILNNSRVYPIAFICNVMLRKISPESKWSERLKNLLSEYSLIPLNSMGFKDKWSENELW
jgi:abortive infection bacteriophage resistance protein